MIKRVALAVLVALVPILTACGADDDPPAPPPAPATASGPLVVQTVNGSGCAAGSATTAAGPDDVAVNYGAFTVTAGGAGFRKFCQLAVVVTPGAGKQAVATTADHAGTATLPGAGAGTVKTTYYVTAGTDLGATTSALAAPTWSAEQATPDAVVGPCGGAVNLNVKTELNVTGAGSSATLSASNFHFDFRDC
jgi:uncharacterized protein DUF4360